MLSTTIYIVNLPLREQFLLLSDQVQPTDWFEVVAVVSRVSVVEMVIVAVIVVAAVLVVPAVLVVAVTVVVGVAGLNVASFDSADVATSVAVVVANVIAAAALAVVAVIEIQVQCLIYTWVKAGMY